MDHNPSELFTTGSYIRTCMDSHVIFTRALRINYLFRSRRHEVNRTIYYSPQSHDRRCGPVYFSLFSFSYSSNVFKERFVVLTPSDTPRDTQKTPNILRRTIVTPFLEVIFTETPMDYHKYGFANNSGVVLNLIQITLTMITNMLE